VTLLSTYETQVADLLHDPNHVQWSITQLDNYINEARRKLVMDTGCLRTLQESFCTQGVEQYQFGQVTGASIISGGSGYTAPTISFSGGNGSGATATLSITEGVITAITFTSFGNSYTDPPTATISDATGTGASISVGVINVNTYDVLNINIIWGAYRYPLEWRSWTNFSAQMRGYTTLTRQPTMWAVYGNTSLFLGPLPDQTYPMEVDSIILPTPLADYVTNDLIPPVAQDPIKFYAAYLAKFYDQSYGESETFKQQYQMRMLEVESAYTRRIPNIYEGIVNTKG
jgi:hypothetical protein